MTDPLQGLTDEEIQGLLQIAKDIYAHSPVELDVKEGTIQVDANLGSTQ